MRACFVPWYPKETSVALIMSSLKHLKIAFLRLPFSHRTRQYHETLFFGNSSSIDITTLSTKPIEKRTASLHMITVLRQPVAKMLRHFTRKTLFLPKHRIKSHISKIKQLPSPSPIFNVALRKFQHDLLLWPTLRRGRGGSKTRGPYRYPWRAN